MPVKTAVIGHPVAHSKSPLIHTYWMAQYGINGTYEAVDILPDHLQTGVRRLVETGYTGFNVTVPHKSTIMALCDTLDDTAQAIGAVNTVTIRDGKFHGANTDAYGFMENVRDAYTPGGRAVILGAGGAAKAVLYGLLQGGTPEIVITNRTKAKALDLTAFDPEKITCTGWDARSNACEHATLIVNTTSLGMTGQPALEIDLSNAAPDALVTDIVYAPLETDLLKQARSKGFKTVTGIGMLLHQARPGFEQWHGILPGITPELERLVTA